MAGREEASVSVGPATDARNQPAVDPTRNVLDLVAAGNQRQDDLREMQARHIHELLVLDREHADALRKAEANRIDAIRTVDVAAVQRAAEVQADTQGTLANQVETTAQAMRAQVAATAAAAQADLRGALEPIAKDIADLRRSQYEAQGVKAQNTETGGASRAWWAIGVAVAAIVSSGLLAIAAIAITLIVKG